MIFFVLVLLSINILSIFGAPTESVDCFKLTQFFENYPGYIFQCCKTNQTTCNEKGNVTGLKVSSNTLTDLDFSKFPELDNLNELVLDGKFYKDGIFPSLFFKQKNLKKLEIINSNVSSFERIPNTCSLESLSLNNSSIINFPEEVLNCYNLKTLNLSYNDIGTIPDNISNLKQLEELYLIKSNLSNLPDSIYELSLKKIYLNNNQNFRISFHNFKKPVEVCSLGYTNLNCYEPGTCLKIIDDPEKSNKEMKEDSFGKCEPLNKKEPKSPSTPSSSPSPSPSPSSTSESLSLSAKLCIVIGAFVFLIIICLIMFALNKYKKIDEIEEIELKGKMSITYKDILNENKGTPRSNSKASASVAGTPGTVSTPFSSPETLILDMRTPSIASKDTRSSNNNNITGIK